MSSTTSKIFGCTYEGAFSDTNAGGSIQLNQWYHVAFVLRNTNGYIYVNGIQVGTGSLFEPSNVTRMSNYIGKSNWGDPNANAIYDDLKIYNGAMSAAEILNDYTTSSSNGIVLK